jgi:hypothetical protein
VRAALHELCAEFGKVTSINIMTMTEAEQRRVSRFGNELLVVVDLPR